jgi:hypothetical protein
MHVEGSIRSSPKASERTTHLYIDSDWCRRRGAKMEGFTPASMAPLLSTSPVTINLLQGATNTSISTLVEGDATIT